MHGQSDREKKERGRERGERERDREGKYGQMGDINKTCITK